MKTILGILSAIFTWWNGATLGTVIMTMMRGKLVGEDEQGNRYYVEAKPTAGRAKARRWVIYNGLADASRVPAEWHIWLHYIVDEAPSGSEPTRPWWKPHKANMTGTPEAYRPDGSLAGEAKRAKATGDYEAWSPE